MTEERFTLDYIQSTWWRITDNSTGKSIENRERVVVDWLNSLNEENEQLKKKNNNYKNDYHELFSDYVALKEENGQLKEQLQMIEGIIQTQIIKKEEDWRISVKGGMPTGGLYSEIEFLEKLKKEFI